MSAGSHSTTTVDARPSVPPAYCCRRAMEPDGSVTSSDLSALNDPSENCTSCAEDAAATAAAGGLTVRTTAGDSPWNWVTPAPKATEYVQYPNCFSNGDSTPRSTPSTALRFDSGSPAPADASTSAGMRQVYLLPAESVRGYSSASARSAGSSCTCSRLS